MGTFEDDEDNVAGMFASLGCVCTPADLGLGSPDTSSENDADEPMEDADDGEGDMDQDADQGGDGDVDGDGDNDNDDDDGENDDDEEQEDTFADSPSQRRGSANGVNNQRSGGDQSRPTVSFTSPSPRPSSNAPSALPFRPTLKPESLSAITYDIVPTMAAPHSTSINAVTATPDMRWVFSGGTDGYIRKFNWMDTANGKLPLTVAQRHPFVDSVTKAGVLMSYWENEEYSRKFAPVIRFNLD
jgi:transcriptional activator SPT8